MSARKMRLVVDNIRGKNIDQALDILRFSKQEASEWLEKLLISAISNWEYKQNGLSADDYELYVKTIYSNAGPMLKRFRPAPHGRAHRIRKHTNHVTIVVENQVPLDSEGALDEEE